MWSKQWKFFSSSLWSSFLFMLLRSRKETWHDCVGFHPPIQKCNGNTHFHANIMRFGSSIMLWWHTKSSYTKTHYFKRLILFQNVFLKNGSLSTLPNLTLTPPPGVNIKFFWKFEFWSKSGGLEQCAKAHIFHPWQSSLCSKLVFNIISLGHNWIN